MSFSAFPPDTLAFLRDLADHNDRDWFRAHEDRYTTSWLEPGVAFVQAVAPVLAGFDPPAHAEPRVNGSLFRIQRDTRFSKDKTPYKTSLAVRFWMGPARKQGASFYFGLRPDGVTIGAGLYHFEKDDLPRYRQAVAGPAGAALQQIVDARLADGWTLGGETLQRVPRGLDADHPRASLLKHKGLWMGEPHHDPGVATQSGFLDHVLDRYRAALPLAAWLQRHVVAA